MQFVQGRAPNYTLPYSPHQLVCYIYQTALANLVDEPSEVMECDQQTITTPDQTTLKAILVCGLAAPHLPSFANMDIYAS